MIFSVPAFAQETTYKTIQNIAYYPENTDGSTEYQNKQCRLDVYYPEGKKDVPVIVWFHGGGLTGGVKAPSPSCLKAFGGTGTNCHPWLLPAGLVPLWRVLTTLMYGAR